MSTEFGATAGTAVQAPVRVHVAWREVALFVVLAYGLAWAGVVSFSSPTWVPCSPNPRHPPIW